MKVLVIALIVLGLWAVVSVQIILDQQKRMERGREEKPSPATMPPSPARKDGE